MTDKDSPTDIFYYNISNYTKVLHYLYFKCVKMLSQTIGIKDYRERSVVGQRDLHIGSEFAATDLIY